MRVFAVIIVMAFSIFGYVGKASAATFYAYTQYGNGGCSDVESTQSSSLAFCISDNGGPLFEAYAESTGGTLKSGANSQTQRINGQLVVNSGAVRSQAFFSDTLYFAENSGTYEFDIDVLGELILASDSVYNSGASVSIDIQANGVLIYEYDAASSTFFDASLGQVVYSGTTPGVIDILDTLSIDYTGGELDLFVSIQTRAACGSITNSNDSCYAEAAFLNSLRITGGTVFDENGNIVSAGFLGSDSGFDYIAGVEGHNRGPSVIPLPAAGWLLLGALAAIGGLKQSVFRGARRKEYALI